MEKKKTQNKTQNKVFRLHQSLTWRPGKEKRHLIHGLKPQSEAPLKNTAPWLKTLGRVQRPTCPVQTWGRDICMDKLIAAWCWRPHLLLLSTPWRGRERRKDTHPPVNNSNAMRAPVHRHLFAGGARPPGPHPSLTSLWRKPKCFRHPLRDLPESHLRS